MKVHRLVAAVFAIVCAAPVAAFPAGEPDTVDKGSRLTLERIFADREFDTESFGPARWLPDGSGYTILEESEPHEGAFDIVLYEAATGVRTVLVSAERLLGDDSGGPLVVEDYSWSDDGTRLLIFTNSTKVWRRNTRGDYWLVRLSDNSLTRLGGDREPSTMMFAKLSPDAGHVAWVDFSSKDLFVQDLHTMEVRRLTDDPGEHIINGTSDWVYEEEFGLRDGFRWSPDGRHIAYWQFDSEGVGTFTLINNTADVYPELTLLPYPKVGTTNSAVRVGVIPAAGGATTWFEPEGDPRTYYIPQMGWAANNEQIWLVRLNRLQNTAEVMLGDAQTGALAAVFTDRDEAWIDMHGDPEWLDDGSSFTWLSERDGWRHLYLVSRSGDEVRLVTAGDYDVIELAHIDEERGWAYFLASPNDPTSRALYRTRLDVGGEPERVTAAEDGGSHRYQIAPEGRWAIHTSSSRTQVPVTELVSLPEHEVVRTLEGNGKLRQALASVDLATVSEFRVDIGGLEVDGWMMTPPDFDPSRKYPMLVYVYGEPAGQTVANSWGRGGNLWYHMLAQQGYVVASLDNRGTPAPRGRDWRKAVYRQIGILASADQAAGVRAIIRKFPFIDSERIASWGWSGGGSMTLNALFRYPELYCVGMAVAFVADQRLYDTIYQERYMGLPEDNEAGYREGSPVNHAKHLTGDLLLIHGTGDDNVHYQNLELLVNELVAHGKPFQMMAYPNRSHSLSEGKGTTMHLYTLLTDFLLEHLAPGPRGTPAAAEPEAYSLSGTPLYAPSPRPEALAAFEAAETSWEASPDDPDAIIWYGRRAAYLGRYREAISIFSLGVERFPSDARFYRHRGHRYVSTRQLENAVADLEHAAWLIEDSADQVEPDGMPNARGIPVSTLHTNIWYHLGLAYYLQGSYGKAQEAYHAGLAATTNDDMRVAFSHWLWMTLRRLDRHDEAAAVVAAIDPALDIIENDVYHRLCLLYAGRLDEAKLNSEAADGPSNAALAYGLANWALVNGRTAAGREQLEAIVAGDGWAAFGHIAAEADLARMARSESADP
ncbi:MAG: DPP IV N-terminal domain-containing protein [Holophagae bacterium]|jgi:dipeptidyl-peptidase-4